MSNLTITRPPQFLDPWFVEIEQVWDSVEISVNDNDSRISTLETSIVSDVVTSVSKQGEAQIQGDATLTGSGSVVLTQVGQNIDFSVNLSSLDHGNLEPTSLLDDDHTQYILVSGVRAFTGNQSFGNNQITNFRVETVAVLPGAGSQGRLVFDQNDLRLKVDDGSSFIQVGETDHNLLSNLAVGDVHTQYLLTDGSRAVTGDFTVNGVYKSEATESLSLESQVTDGASAVGFDLDTANSLSTSGAKLVSVKNNGVEVWWIDKDGVTPGNSVTTVLPAAGGAGIKAAMDAAHAAGGGIVQLLSGTYAIPSSLVFTALDGVTLQGSGKSTILDCTAVFDAVFDCQGFITSSFGGKALNNITAGDTSVFTTTPADAALAVAGGFIRITGTDSLTTELDALFYEVKTSGNIGTGEIVLTGAVPVSITGASINGHGDTVTDCVFKDFDISCSGAGSLANPIRFQGVQKTTIENVNMEGTSAEFSGQAITLEQSKDIKIKNCKFQGMDLTGIKSTGSGLLTIKNCKIEDLGPTFSRGIDFLGGTREVIIDKCEFKNISARGIDLQDVGVGNPVSVVAKTLISNCLFDNCPSVIGNTGAVTCTNGRHLSIKDNIFLNILTSTSRGTYLTTCKHVLVQGNQHVNGDIGIQMIGGDNISIMTNTLRNFSNSGIIGQSSAEIIATGNVLENCSRGIILSVGINSVISSNLVKNSGSQGILIASLCVNNTISNNVTQGSGLNGIDVNNTSTDNIISANNCIGDGISQGTGAGNDFVNNKS